jgi:hypothetical protein
VDFWSVLSGLGPIHKYFSGAKGPAVNFPNAQGPRHNLQYSPRGPGKVVRI